MNRCCRVLAVADDMTGALEVGAKLSALGSQVMTGAEFAFGSNRHAVVIDAETRHVQAGAARAKISAIAEAARGLDVEIVYKKTDSTLRGNIGAELQALACAYPEKPIVFVPAYPTLGRTVRGGSLHVQGEPVHRTTFGGDALNPVATSSIPDMLSECGLRVRLHQKPPAGRLEPSWVHLFDSETEEDVAAAMAFAFAEWPLPVLCGPASVATHIAKAMGCAETIPVRSPVGNALVVNGSRHDVALRQIQDAQDRGWPLLSAEGVLNSPAGWTILAGEEPAERIGAIVREILARTQVDCLVVFGGDTAFAILRALGESTVMPLGELFPGIPISRAGELQLISKAGGFGPVDLLSRIRAAFSGGR